MVNYFNGLKTIFPMCIYKYLQLPMQPVRACEFESRVNHGVVYSIKYYVKKFFSDFWQVGGFLRFH
jgi:hypothetical protein